eukprot:scaffold65679_cov66-Phaeocystis_antarctica.AAC.1
MSSEESAFIWGVRASTVELSTGTHNELNSSPPPRRTTVINAFAPWAPRRASATYPLPTRKLATHVWIAASYYP